MPIEAANDEGINSSSLEMLVGYNSKRVSLAVMNALTTRLHDFGLQRSIDYSVLNLIGHNPGITSRKLCYALEILPPNMVGILKNFEDRNILERRLHPSDRRSQTLYLTKEGLALHSKAETVVNKIDIDITHALNESERAQLNALLRRIYVSGRSIA